MPNPNLARSSCLTSSRSTSWRATASASKNLAPGRLSRRQSQQVLLPVEMPPVTPIAGLSAPLHLRFLRPPPPPPPPPPHSRLSLLLPPPLRPPTQHPPT